MSQIIPLQTIANQSFTIFLDGSNYDFTIKETNGVMSVNIVRDGEILQQGERAVAQGLLLPYKYQELGNFMFLTQNGELPFYTKFNSTQVLYYFSIDEISALTAT